MSKICQLTGVGPSSGHQISHSNKKSNRRFLPNLVKKTVLDPKTGTMVSLKITARALRTLAKNPKKFSAQITAIAKKKLEKKSEVK